MVRFIVLTFGFLGWAFYEMSGGADFDAEALRMSRIDADQIAPVTATTPKTLLAEVDTSDTGTAEVTRVALNLTTTRDIVAPAKPLPTAPAPAKFDGAVLSTASLETPETPEIILPSLIPAAEPEAQTTAELLVDEDNGLLDVRAVSGSRVNMRDGPGTYYDVVSNLTRGTLVEILQDPGNGWVKLRPMDGGPEGWMAASLLTNS